MYLYLRLIYFKGHSAGATIYDLSTQNTYAGVFFCLENNYENWVFLAKFESMHELYYNKAYSIVGIE